MPSITLRQLEDLLFESTVLMAGIGSANIQFEWQPNSAPFREQNVNAVYMSIVQIDSNADKATYTALTPNTSTAGTSTQYYTRIMQCKWSVYGPDSFDKADLIRNGLMTEGIRGPLAVQGVFPIVGIQAAQRAPDLINNQWWERSILTARFSVYTEHSADQPYFGSATVGFKESGGDSELITIQP